MHSKGCLMVKNQFVKSNENHEWEHWFQTLLDLYETEKHFAINQEVHRSSYLNMKRWILAHPFAGKNKLLTFLLLDSMLSAEKEMPGSEIYIPWFVWHEVQPFVERQSSEKYLNYVLDLTNNKSTKDLFTAVYNTAGPLTRIIIKPSSMHDVVIKYRNSFNFPLKPDPQFHKIVGNVNHVTLTNPIVVMIEGAPETVGEINSLLQWNHG